MVIKPIRTEADHAVALAEIWRLHDAKVGTPDYDTLEVLSTLVDAYEDEHMPILPPDPVEAIKFRLEQEGKTRKDLEPIIGTRARVSEILSRTRGLSLAMIRALHEALSIPLEILVLDAMATKVAKKAKKAKAKKVKAAMRVVKVGTAKKVHRRTRAPTARATSKSA